MDFRFVSLGFFILAVICLPVWPYSANWTIYPSVFCVFIAALTFLVNLFGKRGSTVWKGKGQG
jgi:hypothetical protein